jgi:plastocyanin
VSRSGLMPVVATALLSVAACDGPDSRGDAQRHVVEIRAFGYHPASLAVMPGDTVVWVNIDAVPHTATSRDGAWDSGSIASGASWILVASEAAIRAYICDFHPSMAATLKGSETHR